ncbi:MAG: LrgB family protein [Oleispira antarctica]|nr:LrgB family protein [Oleispira antarctica]
MPSELASSESIITTLLQLPSTWLMITLGAYLMGLKLYKQTNNSPWLPPVLSGFALVIAMLWLTDTPYSTYQQGGQLLSFFLGPVVVGLAIPLFHHFHNMRRQFLRLLLAIILGSFTTVLVAVVLTHYWIGIDVITVTMASKSVTTPVAVAIAEQTAGLPALAAAFVMVTGIIGAAIIPLLLKWLSLDSPQITGMSLGICAHAVGTSRALELGQEYAAYSAMAMTLTAALHAIVLPWLF